MKISNPHLRKFVKQVREKAECYGVTVKFVPRSSVKTEEGFAVSGFFQSDPGRLVVAIGRPEKEWSVVLAHEYNHMLQWIRRSPAWRQTLSKNGIDYAIIMDCWLSGLCELTDEQRNTIFSTTIALELECERMTLKLLLSHPAFEKLNPTEYIMKSNAYLCFYQYVAVHRKWYKAGRGPYAIKSIWQSMPAKFQDVNFYLTASDVVERLYEPVYGVRRGDPNFIRVDI